MAMVSEMVKLVLVPCPGTDGDCYWAWEHARNAALLCDSALRSIVGDSRGILPRNPGATVTVHVTQPPDVDPLPMLVTRFVSERESEVRDPWWDVAVMPSLGSGTREERAVWRARGRLLDITKAIDWEKPFGVTFRDPVEAPRG